MNCFTFYHPYCQAQVTVPRVPRPDSPLVLTKSENTQKPIFWTGAAQYLITWAITTRGSLCLLYKFPLAYKGGNHENSYFEAFKII